MAGENGWDEYKRLILAEIDELKAAKKDLEDMVQELRVEVATLKTKIWIHMLLTGSAAAGGSAAMEWLFP